jgi:predicted nuclease of predicted toxin-antitoxin system
VKLLIDECLHTSLVELAHGAGHLADHVNYLSLGGYKDWQLMAVIREQDYTFVTNNRTDFLGLHGKEPLHAGVIIIVPNIIEGNNVVYSIVLTDAKNPLSREEVETHFEGELSRLSPKPS